MIKYELKGSEKVKALLENKNKAAIQAIAEANVNVAIFMEGKVKDSIAGRSEEPRSVDTGNMMRNVVGRGVADGAVITGEAEYTIYLEEGTSKIRGRHHFRNSLERNKSDIRVYYADKIKQI